MCMDEIQQRNTIPGMFHVKMLFIGFVHLPAITVVMTKKADTLTCVTQGFKGAYLYSTELSS